MGQNFQVTTTLNPTGNTREMVYDLIRFAEPTEQFAGDGLAVRDGRLFAGDGALFWRKYTKTYANLQAANLSNDIELMQLPGGAQVHAVKLVPTAQWTGALISDVKLSVGVNGALAQYLRPYTVSGAPGDTNFAYTHLAPWNLTGIPADGAFGTVVLPVTPVFTNVDGAIGGLPIAASYNQTEVTNLRNACETLADDTRALRTAYDSQRTMLMTALANMEALRDALEQLRAGTYQSNGAHHLTNPTSVRLAATATGANLSALTAGSVDVWMLFSVATL